MVQRLSIINAPFDLEANVWLRLNQAQRRQAKIQLLVLGMVDLLSVTGLIASLFYLANLLALSGFWQYLTLIYFDGNLVLSYWQAFALSLIESLPVLGLIFLFCALAVSIWSFAKTIINARIILLTA